MAKLQNLRQQSNRETRLRTILQVSRVLLCASLLFAACWRSGNQEIQIGGLLPLTGSGANYGLYAKNGMDLAVDEINRAGGVTGKKLVVIYEDSQSNPATGVSGFRKLLDVNQVSA